MQTRTRTPKGLKAQHVGFFGLTAVLALLDISSKVVAFNAVPPGIEREVVAPVLYLQLAHNPGGLFGFGGEHTWIFILVSFFTMALIVWMYFAMGKERLTSAIGLAFILGGAVGNLWDRIFFGYVRDFILLRAGDYSWPNFNVADIWICVGVGILIIWTLRNPNIGKEAEEKGRAKKDKAKSSKK